MAKGAHRVFVQPPFRPHSESEVEQQIQQINSSGVQVLFVGLGCPK